MKGGLFLVLDDKSKSNRPKIGEGCWQGSRPNGNESREHSQNQSSDPTQRNAKEGQLSSKKQKKNVVNGVGVCYPFARKIETGNRHPNPYCRKDTTRTRGQERHVDSKHDIREDEHLRKNVSSVPRKPQNGRGLPWPPTTKLREKGEKKKDTRQGINARLNSGDKNHSLRRGQRHRSGFSRSTKTRRSGASPRKPGS